MRYRLRTLMILLAVLPPLVGGACLYVNYSLDWYDLWHNEHRYHELEERLIQQGAARRGANGEVLINRDYKQPMFP